MSRFRAVRAAQDLGRKTKSRSPTQGRSPERGNYQIDKEVGSDSRCDLIPRCVLARDVVPFVATRKVGKSCNETT
jgi:hypothetical protein